MIAVGIDEAGYGPLLGPLVVAGTAFRVADEPSPGELTKRLRFALRAAGLRVDDSKRIFGGARDLAALETPLLAFLHAATQSPGRLDELLTALGADACARTAIPWYAGEPVTFPCKAAIEDVHERAEALRTALATVGLEFLGFAADVVPEARFNASLGQGNKADALFGVATGVFDRFTSRRRNGEPLSAVFDRHGGRHFYGAKLQRRWPQALASPLSESPLRSDYRLHFADAPVDFRFEVEADGVYAHVALASMLAKYVREVFMGLFNAHFGLLCPGIAPTAGYVTDARRWLDETRAARVSSGVPDSALVRQR